MPRSVQSLVESSLHQLQWDSNLAGQGRVGSLRNKHTTGEQLNAGLLMLDQNTQEVQDQGFFSLKKALSWSCQQIKRFCLKTDYICFNNFSSENNFSYYFYSVQLF